MCTNRRDRMTSLGADALFRQRAYMTALQIASDLGERARMIGADRI